MKLLVRQSIARQCRTRIVTINYVLLQLHWLPDLGIAKIDQQLLRSENYETNVYLITGFLGQKMFLVIHTRVGSWPYRKHQTRLEKCGWDKHSSLQGSFVSYEENKVLLNFCLCYDVNSSNYEKLQQHQKTRKAINAHSNT